MTVAATRNIILASMLCVFCLNVGVANAGWRDWLFGEWFEGKKEEIKREAKEEAKKEFQNQMDAEKNKWMGYVWTSIAVIGVVVALLISRRIIIGLYKLNVRK